MSKLNTAATVDGHVPAAHDATEAGASSQLPAPMPIPAPMPMPASYSAINRNGTHSLHELSHKVLTNLKNLNFSVIDNFLQEPLLSEILQDIRSFYHETDSFHPGQLIQMSRLHNTGVKKKEIRGDFVAWVDLSTNPNMKSLFSAVRCTDELIAIMGATELLADCNIRSRSSIMVACYPGEGTRYKRHVDNPSKDGRKLTTILYLNKDYDSSRDGGMLRIYKPNSSSFYDIAPTYGRLVIFWSDSRTPHEVLPSFSERFAVSVWYFDTKERTEALDSAHVVVPFNH